VTEYDLKRLREVILDADSIGYKGSTYIEALRGELQRAKIVTPQEIPANVITMNSRVLLRDNDSGEEMTLTLVFPQDADVMEDKISVLAPIGTAILGYCEGDTVEWEVPDGLRRLVVEKVLYQPEASGDMDL
jgi:regulator of nucleoside diphosphate kinase